MYPSSQKQHTAEGQVSQSYHQFDDVKNRLYTEAKALYRDEASRHTNDELRRMDIERLTKMRQQICSQALETAKDIGSKKPIFDGYHKKFHEQQANIDLFDGFFQNTEENKKNIMERFEKETSNVSHASEEMDDVVKRFTDYQDWIHQRRDRMKAMQEERAQYDIKRKEASGNVTQLEAAMASLGVNQQTVENSNEKLSEQLSALDLKSKELDLDTDKLQQEQKKAEMELSQSVKQKEYVRKRIQELKLAIMEESKSLHEMSRRMVTAAKEDIFEKDRIQKIEASIKMVKEENTTVEMALHNKRSKIEQNQMQIEKLSELSRSNEEKITASQERNKTEQKNFMPTLNAISNLEKDSMSQEEYLRHLDEKLKEEQEKKESMDAETETRIHPLVEEIDATKKEKANLEHCAVQRVATMDQLNVQIQQLEKELAETKSAGQGLNKEIAAVKDTIADVNDQLSKYDNISGDSARLIIELENVARILESDVARTRTKKTQELREKFEAELKALQTEHQTSMDEIESKVEQEFSTETAKIDDPSVETSYEEFRDQSVDQIELQLKEKQLEQEREFERALELKREALSSLEQLHQKLVSSYEECAQEQEHQNPDSPSRTPDVEIKDLSNRPISSHAAPAPAPGSPAKPLDTGDSDDALLFNSVFADDLYESPKGETVASSAKWLKNNSSTSTSVTAETTKQRKKIKPYNCEPESISFDRERKKEDETPSISKKPKVQSTRNKAGPKSMVKDARASSSVTTRKKSTSSSKSTTKEPKPTTFTNRRTREKAQIPGSSAAKMSSKKPRVLKPKKSKKSKERTFQAKSNERKRTADTEDDELSVFDF